MTWSLSLMSACFVIVIVIIIITIIITTTTITIIIINVGPLDSHLRPNGLSEMFGKLGSFCNVPLVSAMFFYTQHMPGSSQILQPLVPLANYYHQPPFISAMGCFVHASTGQTVCFYATETSQHSVFHPKKAVGAIHRLFPPWEK